jgi:hypothetical protein
MKLGLTQKREMGRIPEERQPQPSVAQRLFPAACTDYNRRFPQRIESASSAPKIGDHLREQYLAFAYVLEAYIRQPML